MNHNYYEEMRMHILGCIIAPAGDYGYHIVDEDDPNCIVLTVPAENAINGMIEIRIQIIENGMYVMWYYPTIALKEDDNQSEEEKYRIATELSVAFNNFTDKTDELVTHTLCINHEDGDIFWKSFYNRALFYPFSKEGTIRVLKDIIRTQPKRFESMCFPVFAALIGKLPVEKANDIIEKMRKE